MVNGINVKYDVDLSTINVVWIAVKYAMPLVFQFCPKNLNAYIYDSVNEKPIDFLKEKRRKKKISFKFLATEYQML